MSYDPAQVYYVSESPIDKILLESNLSSSNFSGGGTVSPLLTGVTISHNLGIPVAVNGMFSLDNSNFYPGGLRIQGSVSGVSLQPQFIQGYFYGDSSNVYIYMLNGFDSTQNVFFYYALESIT